MAFGQFWGGKHTIFLQSAFISLDGVQEGTCEKSVDRPPQGDVVNDGLDPHPVPLCQLQSDRHAVTVLPILRPCQRGGVQGHSVSDSAIDADVHNRSLGSIGEDLEREGVDSWEGCREDSQCGVVGVAVVEDDLVKLEGTGDLSGRVVC